MKLTCWRMRRSLARLADLEAGVPVDPPLARHLAACPACRAEWDALRALTRELPQALPGNSLPEGFEAAVWSRIAAAERPGRLSGAWAYLALGGAAAGVAGAVLLGSRPGAVTPPQPPHPDPRIARQPQPALPPPKTPPSPRQPAFAERHGLRRAPQPRLATRERPSSPTAAPVTPAVPDERFLDGREALPARWSPQGVPAGVPLPPLGDDFVRVAPPRLAAGGPGGSRAVSQAMKEHEAQARVVDSRLFRTVTLQLKGASLEELCAELKAQTGVELSAARGVQDEKVTVFVKEQRARDVMRAVARLFGYVWGRTGGEKEYRYELVQDLRGQLEEEELRNRDQNAALLALDAEMEKLRPYLALPFEQLKQRWDETGDKALFNLLFGGGWGGMQVYHRLTPAERARLASGREVVLRADATDPEHHLPEAWQSSLLRSWSSNVDVQGRLTPVHEAPGIRISQLRLLLDRSELGQTSVRVQMSADWPEGGGKAYISSERTLATGQSPSVARPDNAVRNAPLQGKAPFDREVRLRPEPSCPRLKQRRPGETEEPPHLFSADVWEAVHRETGLPIVADYYTRLYPTRKLGDLHGSLFDVLCRAGEELGVRWTRDGEFLLGRSTGYFWDKLKEVPNRDLQRWRGDRQENGGLSLSGFLQMATLSDRQLESATVTRGVVHCWDLPEWEILGGRPRAENPLVSGARFLALLTREQQLRALAPEGISVRELTGIQHRALLQLWAETQASFERQQARTSGTPPEMLAAAHFVAEYTPAGWWQWAPPLSTPEHPWPRTLAPVTAPTEAALRAEVRRLYPEVSGGQVTRSARGHFSSGIRYGPFPAGSGGPAR